MGNWKDDVADQIANGCEPKQVKFNIRVKATHENIRRLMEDNAHIEKERNHMRGLWLEEQKRTQQEAEKRRQEEALHWAAVQYQQALLHYVRFTQGH